MKRAIVTGAAQGIGLAVAQALKATGHKVIGVDRQGDVEQRLDLANPSEIAEFTQSVGSVDYLVNCAGVCVTQPLDDISVDCWDRTLDINTRGPFLLSRAIASKHMPEGGSIVNIASVSGFLPKLEQVDYGASKAALVSLTRSMALIYGPKGIRVNAVAPGVIETPLTHQIAEQRGKLRGVDPMETLQPVIQQTPLRRIGTAQEVANAVLFLLSDQASFITGQTLNVCGGFLMR